MTRRGMVPSEAHNLAFAGSIPAAATTFMLDLMAWGVAWRAMYGDWFWVMN
jgi:hypothetical protein